MSDGIFITELRAEHVKRLKAVRIAFDGDGLTIISGPNGAGKSSAIDSFLFAVGGESAIDGDPINLESDTAKVEVDLSDGRKIIRHFKRDPDKPKGYMTKLELLTADGGSVGSKQTTINAWLEPIAFDPLEFSQMDGKKRRAVLANLVGIDLEAFAARHKAVSDKRQAHSGVHRAAQGRIKDLAKPGKPGDLVDVGELNAELGKALAAKEEYQEVLLEKQRLESVAQGRWAAVENNKALVQATREKIKDLQALLINQERLVSETTAEAEAADKAAAGVHVPDALPDIDYWQQRLAESESINTAVREAIRASAEYDRLHADFAEQDKIRNAFTAELEAIEAERTAALAGAEYPVDGLSFDDDDILLNGLPFANASMSERLKVGVAVAVALNPELRVIISKDGSLLDGSNKAEVARLAHEYGVRVILECVADAPDGSGIFILDGEVVE